MTKAIQRTVSFLLVAVLLIGMVPMAYAEEPNAADNLPAENEEVLPQQSDQEQDETPTPQEEVKEDEVVTDEPSAEGKPEKKDYPMASPDEKPPADEKVPEKTVSIDDSFENIELGGWFDEEDLEMMTANEIMTLALDASVAQMAVVWVNTDERAPTGATNRFIYYQFPTGTSKNRNNIGLHMVKVNGTWKAGYCIEPGIGEGSSYQTDTVTLNQYLGSYLPPSTLTEAQLKAMAVALLYGQVSKPTANNDDLGRMTATQIILWEIAIGWRSCYAPFAQTNDAFIRRFAKTSVYPEVTSSYFGSGRLSNIQTAYNEISAAMAKHYTVPSFTSFYQSSAPTITLQPDGTGRFTATVTDTNGILSSYSFQNTSQLSFSKSGNTLTITANSPVTDTLVAPTKQIPSIDNQTYYVWTNGTKQQLMACETQPYNSPVPAYFKVTTPAGGLKITKTTDDGKNLSGWKFGIYSNSACTNLISGPYTTGSTGVITVSGLTTGTVWVKELGNTNSTVSSQYSCANNPQSVYISAGSKASVTFQNNLNLGSLRITKATNTGKNLTGWKIGLYTDVSCSSPVSGSPFTTGTNGTVTVSLSPGTYYAREVDESASNPYWEYDTVVKPVTVTSSGTATVSFTNIQYGELRIHKNAVNGSAEGWTFYLYSEAGDDILKTMKTGADGYAYSGRLLPGTYTVREAKLGDETYWEYDVNVDRTVTITAGSQTSIEYTNTQYGMLEFHKTTNTGHHLEGWTFLLYKDGEKIGEYATDANGYACTGKLAPGRYSVQERLTEDVYWIGDLNIHTVTVTAGETAADYWRNCETGRGIFRKTTNTGENLSGWIITIYSDAACTQEVKTVTTEGDGTVNFMLEPGTYYAKETGDTNGRFESEYWLVDGTAKQFEIKGHADTEVNFVNTHSGKILVVKTMEDDSSPENWQFRITNKAGDSITAATDANGQLLTDNLLPGEYTVEEIFPTDCPYLCLSSNPQKITVAEGKTAEVSFVNGIRTGRIVIQKNDITGNPLADAQFVLEWSGDGTKWTIVTASEKLEKGKCQADGLINGCLTTGKTGLIQWTNLYPGLYYRVTEVRAPNGYLLLDKPVFSGKLSGDKLEASFTVVNTREFTMPKTGSDTMRIITTTSTVLYALTTVTMILLLRRKKESWE